MNDQQPNDFQPQSAPPGLDNTASYQKRFWAFAIDIVLMFIAWVFFISLLGIEPAKTTDLQAAQVELAAKLAALSDVQKTLLVFSPIIVFFLLHSFSLYQYGQTLGKRFVGIAIVTLDNQKPAFFALIGQRYCSQWLMSMVPMVGIALRLADVLMIFRGDKRCLHDLIARTKVIDLSVKVSATPNSFVA